MSHNQETLMDMQQKCAALNKDSLRNARNLQDLVNIRVHAIDKSLGSQKVPRTVEGERENYAMPNYDF